MSVLAWQLEAQTIEVLDFHSTHRCRTCVSIEKSARAALESHFGQELAAGTVVFKTINVDDPQNARMAEQFEAAGSALWVYCPDTQAKVDLTDFAFMNIGNAEKFRQRIVAEVRKALS